MGGSAERYPLAMRTMLLVLLFAGLSASAQNGETRQPRLIPLHGMTEDVQILYGNPDVPGEPFVMRIRELPGGVIPPHRHPVDEHITVVQGTLWFAIGNEKFDTKSMQKLETGAYAFIPKGSTMMGWTPDAAVVQVHGIVFLRPLWIL